MTDAPTIPASVRRRWLPPPRHDIVRWLKRNAWFPKQITPVPGRWNPQTTPYTVEPLQSIANPEIERVVLMWATQTGKTAMWNLAALYQLATDPGPTMVVAATQDSAKDLSEMKIQPMIAACPETRRQLPPPHQIQAMLVNCADAPLYFAWSGSVSRIGEKAVRYLYLTEIDLFDSKATSEGDSQKLAEQRIKAFMNATTVLECSPSEEGASRVHNEYRSGDRRTFWVPCPFCREYQPFRFWPGDDGRGGVRWDDAKADTGHTPSPEQARDAAYYACAHCFDAEKQQPRIEDRHKPEMLRRGVWVPEGMGVQRDGDKPVLTGKPEHPSKRCRSYRLSSLYSPFRSFGQVAEEFLRAGHNPELLKAFYNKWLALPWRPITNKPKWEHVRERLRTPRPRGQVPPGTAYLTGAMDVQKYAFFHTVVAWTADGKGSLVEHGQFARLKPDWQTIREAIHTALLSPVFRDAEGKPFQVAVAGVDTGFDTNLCYQALSQLDPARVMAIKGDPGTGTRGKPYHPSTVHINPATGKPFAGSMRLWHVDVNQGLQAFYAAIDPQADPAYAFELHDDPDEDLMRQLTAKSLEARLNKKTGQTRYEYVLVDQEAGDHFLDTVIYQYGVLRDVAAQFVAARSAPAPRVRVTMPE